MNRHLAPFVLAVLALVSSLLVAPLPAAAQDRLTFDDLFEEDRGGRRADVLGWVGDGSRLAYRWELGPGDERDGLFLVSFEDAGNQDVVPWERLTEGDPEASSLHWLPDGSGAVVEAEGDLHLWTWEDGARRLTETDADEEDPKVSPDGSHVAFVRDADLYAVSLTSDAGETLGAERRLTTGGVPGEILHGTTDWVYWEEIYGRAGTGFWWSPDSTRIAYYEFDDREVGEYPLVADAIPYPTSEPQRYPKAGTTNPTVRLGVLHLDTGSTTWLATGDGNDGDHPYLARVDWLPDSSAVAVQRLDREQDALDLLYCQPTAPAASNGGKGACHVVIEERWPTWINLGDDHRFLDDGRILWASERSGWRHLYLYSADGELIRPVTSGAGWFVSSVDHVGDGRVVFTHSGTGPLGAARRMVSSVSLGGGEPTRESREDGWHGANVSPDGRHWVHTWSDADDPGWQRVEDLADTPDETTFMPLPEDKPAFEPSELPQWRFFQIEGPEGPLPAAMLEPVRGQATDGAGPAPAIMYHYGGPGSQVVRDAWGSRGRSLWHKMMAQRGFAVLTVDNRASTFFGKRGEDRVHRRFGEVNLEAQSAGAAYLSGLDSVDGERIGLWGWSGGGTHTLYCLSNSPGTWAAGVAGAPVTDWRLYDTIWTERYLDHPRDNAAGYQASSPVTYGEKLEDPLLLIHGLADDNVHPHNTTALTAALVEAGIPFEMAVYPGQKHGFQGASARHFYDKMTEFFDRHLGDR